MSDDAFTVTEVTRRLDGTITADELTADIDAIVAGVVQDLAQRKQRRANKPLLDRLRDAGRDLQRLPDAYRRGLQALDDSEHDVLIRSAANVTMGSHGKPQSRPPAGADRALRAQLVMCAQRVMAAIRELADMWDWHDTDLAAAWEPDGLAYERNGVVACHGTGRCDRCSGGVDGSVCWRDPDDITTSLPSLASLSDGVSQLRGLLRWLERYDWDSLAADHPSVVMVADCLHRAHMAVGALKAAGVWALPSDRVQVVVSACGHCRLRDAQAGKAMCFACEKAHVRRSCSVCGLGRVA